MAIVVVWISKKENRVVDLLDSAARCVGFCERDSCSSISLSGAEIKMTMSSFSFFWLSLPSQLVNTHTLDVSRCGVSVG